jgi:hypothetical protein
MSNATFVSDITSKTSARQSRQAVKRVGLALAERPSVRCSSRLWLRLPHDRVLPVCQSRFQDRLARSVWVRCGAAGGRQPACPACEGRPIAGADRRSRFQSGARLGERGRRRRGTQPRRAAGPATTDHRTECGRHRRRSNSEYGRRCSRTAFCPFEILSSLPPNPAQKRLAFAVVRRNSVSAST